jgi:hypothetical protein
MDPDPTDLPQPATRLWIVLFSSYLIVLNLVLFYLLFKVWPGQVPMKSDYSEIRLLPGFGKITIWNEARYLLIVVFAGALGSYIHLATSFADYVGNRQFVTSWKSWYVLRPFIGSALALIIYFGARGGLISGTTGADSLSPYGIAALAGMTGMFSKQAADKLREVFENLFKTEKPPRTDALTTSTDDGRGVVK